MTTVCAFLCIDYTQSPTIFPLLFAAVISRHLKAVMLRMLERGARLGDLDLMAGSNTVGSTIFTVFALRTVNMLAIALLIIWSLSPIGSQASLRVVTTRSSVESRPVSVKYLSLNQTYGAFEAGSKQSVEAVITGLFNSALLGHQQTRDSPRDLWDWVKVPMMEGLEHEPGPASNGGWHNIPQSRVQYSSLIGIPIIGLEEGSETVVNIESFYWDVDCPLLTPYEQPRDSFSYESGYKNGWWALESLTGNSRFATNRSEMMPAANPANYTPGTESCIDGAAITDELLDPREFSYHGFCGPTGSGDFGALCKMTTTYVEVELKCVGALCTASRIRRSNLEHPMPAWTILDTKCRWWGDFIRSLLATIEVKTSGLPTLIDGYLLDPDSHVSPLLDLPCTSVGNETFAFRLAQLLNAFWLITAAPWVIPYGLDGVPDGVYDGDVDLYSAVGLQSSTFEVIQCRFGWLVVLIFASTLLLAAAITSIVIRYMNVTPELSLNWSTMIRDNRYAKIPSTGSYLEDIERSRLLKSTNLMFGDVAAREDVGHLALSTTSGSRTVARVRPDRIFD